MKTEVNKITMGGLEDVASSACADQNIEPLRDHELDAAAGGEGQIGQIVGSTVNGLGGPIPPANSAAMAAWRRLLDQYGM